MEAPIEIKINSQVLEKIIIQSLEQSIPVNKNQTNDSEYLKCVGSKDTMEILGIGKRAFENLVSTYEKCVIAKEKVDAATSTKD